MCWIIVVNSTQYRIYQYDKKQHQLTLLKEFEHAEGRMKASDLTSDRPGHYQARGGLVRGSFSERTDPKENEMGQYLRALVEELEAGRVANQYKNFILITPPHIDGLLTNLMNKNLQRLMIGNVKKDYFNLSTQELTHYLRENWLDITK